MRPLILTPANAVLGSDSGFSPGDLADDQEVAEGDVHPVSRRQAPERLEVRLEVSPLTAGPP